MPLQTWRDDHVRKLGCIFIVNAVSGDLLSYYQKDVHCELKSIWGHAQMLDVDGTL
jgi:hypothetical protein